MKKIKGIVNASRNIERLSKKLPAIALDKIQNAQMLTEIKSSQDIEGVKSTRKELEAALSAQNSKKKIRFKSIVGQYAAMLLNQKLELHEPEEIRAIYDVLFQGEIEEENLPDGKIFRKGPVQIVDATKGKAVHSGDPSEDVIEANIRKLLKLMNEDTESDIIKAIITHYIFESIHPFYDGNGRMGRFLLSSYLARKLDPFSALSVSTAILQRRNRYEAAFSEVSHPANRGELSLFISEMMTLILEGQESALDMLSSAVAKMDMAREYIQQEGFSDRQKGPLFILLQHFLFASKDDVLSSKELQRHTQQMHLGLSRRRLDIILAELEAAGYLKQVSRNPIAYRLLPDKLPVFD